MSSKTELRLTETNPKKRLKELELQSPIRAHFKRYEFSNGFLCTCSLLWNAGGFSRNRKFDPFLTRCMFVQTDNIDEAENVVCAHLLNDMGLSIDDRSDEEQLESASHDLLETSMRVIQKFTGNSINWADVVSDERKE